MADVLPEAIYHLAAMTHVGESWENPGQVLRVNVLGTAEILAAARSIGGSPRVLVVSSAEVYGIVTPAQLPIGEDTPTEPASPYAASKLAAEAVAFQAWRGFGQPVVVGGPSTTSARDSRPISSFPHWPSGSSTPPGGARSLPVGTLTTRRDFNRRARCGAAYRLLIERGVPGEVYNVCSGRDVADVGVRPSSSSWPGGPHAADRPALVRPVDVPVLRGSAERLRAATGWVPQIPLATTLADVLTSWEAD